MLTAEGFVYDLPEQEYHADHESLSVSGAKLMLKAPALFKWTRDNGQEPRDHFDLGHAAHALVLGIGASILVCPFDSWRSKDAQQMRDDARAKGETALLTADYERVVAMADALASHSLAMRLLSDGKPEVSAYAIHEPTGVMRRCRFDWLAPNVLTDYKTAAGSVDPRDLAGRYGSVKKWGYDHQAAWYTDVARQLGHPTEAFAFIFQSKEPPHLVTVAYVPDSDLWDARARNAEALERFRDCTESGIWPGYLPDDTAAVLSLTDQTYYEERIA